MATTSSAANPHRASTAPRIASTSDATPPNAAFAIIPPAPLSNSTSSTGAIPSTSSKATIFAVSQRSTVTPTPPASSGDAASIFVSPSNASSNASAKFLSRPAALFAASAPSRA